MIELVGLSVLLAAVVLVSPRTKSSRFVDLDSATLGIFVNNLTFHHRYDFSFPESKEFQDQYRGWWAAAELPLTAPTSALQRILRIPPYSVDGLVRALGVFLGLFGSVVAGFALAPPNRPAPTRVAVVVGLTALFPPFFLYLRSGFPNILMAFLLFWLGIFFSVRYGRTGSTSSLYALAAILAAISAHPYPPLVILPFACLLTLVVYRRVGPALRSPHLYFAGALSVALGLGISWGLAVGYVGSFATAQCQIRTFRAWRSSSVSWHELRDVPLREKAQKLLNQHLLFKRDSLGDWTRSDRLWTPEKPHRIWWVVAPIGLIGAFVGWRARERETRLAVLIVLLALAFFFTFSFPEGRFILVVIPCYMHLIDRGFALLPARQLIAAAVLLLFFAETRRLLSEDRTFEAEGLQQEQIRWASQRAWTESAGGHSCIVFPFAKNYFNELFFRMITNNESSWLTAEDLASKSGPCKSVFAVCPTTRECSQRWAASGFRYLDSFRQSGRPVLLLRRTEDTGASGR